MASTLRDERSRQSAELILTAAADLIAERGYRQTSFVDVAERSGVSRGSIPWHFGDKRGLLLAVVERLLAEWHEAVAATPLHPGARGARDIGHLAMTAVRSRTTRLMLSLLLEAGDVESPIHGSFVTLHDVFRDRVAQWARHPDVAGRLPGGVEPQALSVVVLGAVMGVNQQWSLSPHRVDLGQAYDALTAMLLSLVSDTAPSAGRSGAATSSG